MLLKSYSKEILRPECNPGFESVHCIAHLDQDISAVLPYLNAVLGGFEYLKDPPAVIFRSQGKFITVHGLSHYSCEILGIARDATQRQVKQAYRGLAMKFHPDRNPGRPEAAERFKQIQQAEDMALLVEEIH